MRNIAISKVEISACCDQEVFSLCELGIIMIHKLLFLIAIYNKYYKKRDLFRVGNVKHKKMSTQSMFHYLLY